MKLFGNILLYYYYFTLPYYIIYHIIQLAIAFHLLPVYQFSTPKLNTGVEGLFLYKAVVEVMLL